MTVKDQLNMLVKEMIKEHTGGEEFFDALDEAVRNESWFDILNTQSYRYAETRFKDLYPSTVCPTIVVSGKFGLYFKEWYEEFGSVLLVNGSLRHGSIMDLSPFRRTIQNETFIFLDDSFFKGRTRNKIKAELERNGGKLLHTFVVYDGSREKDPDVTSLYRYWDHH
jgi:hypothetical protein